MTTTSGRSPRGSSNLDGYTLLHCTARYRLTDGSKSPVASRTHADENYQDVWGYATPGRSAYLGLDVRL